MHRQSGSVDASASRSSSVASDASRSTILVTGAAGFIGSHLARALLLEGHAVRGLDNLSAVGARNVPAVTEGMTAAQVSGFTLVEGDVVDPETCRRAADGVDRIVHLAAVSSVPRSFTQPSTVVTANVVGTTNVLEAAVHAGVQRVVFASSSAVYGDAPDAVRVEGRLGRSLSPYAASKRACELLAEAYTSAYGLETIGLRYFNVFGTRQNSDGDDAAVIARWVERALEGRSIEVFGSGTQSRDFTHVSNVVDATCRAALEPAPVSGVYNVGDGVGTSLLQLAQLLREVVAELCPAALPLDVRHQDPRLGDVMAATADLTAATEGLGYAPRTSLVDGLRELVAAQLH